MGDLILVVDIGGGTTDFTLIAVTEAGGELALDRVAVGEHILLGGDNIDLALAGVVAQRLAEKGTRIDSRQLQALWAQLPRRQGKAARSRIRRPRSSRSRFWAKARAWSAARSRPRCCATISNSVLGEGFLPGCRQQRYARAASGASGLQELGLPYAADAAITRHMARFLRQQAATAEHGAVRRGPSGLACPTHVLFNGGVLQREPGPRAHSGHAERLARRRKACSRSKPLSGEDLMHAVSRGAAYYGLARHGKGVRIRGGVPRTYYVGIESAMPSVPGFPAPLKALTVVPVRHGGRHRPAHSRIASSAWSSASPRSSASSPRAARKNDQPGDLIEDFGDELEELSPDGSAASAPDESSPKSCRSRSKP